MTANVVDATGPSRTYEKAINSSADNWTLEKRDEWRQAMKEQQAAAVGHDSSKDYLKILWKNRRKVVKDDRWDISWSEIGEIKNLMKGVELPPLIKDLHHNYKQVCLKCTGFHERMNTKKCEGIYKINIAKHLPSSTTGASRVSDILVNMAKVSSLDNQGIEVPDSPKEIYKFLAWDTGLVGIDLW